MIYSGVRINGMDFLTAETTGGGLQLVRVGGQLGITVAAELNHRLVALLGASNRLVVDLSRVDFVDSSILGVLISCHRRARAGGGQLALVGLQPTVHTVFDTMGLTKLFGIYDTVEQVPAPRAAG